MNNKKAVPGNIGKAAGKAVDVGVKVADTGVRAAKGAGEKAVGIKQSASERIQQKRLKANYPVYFEEFSQPGYNIPDMILIVDDAMVKKDDETVFGEMGWRTKVKNAEVFRLYDEEVSRSGLQFVPAPYNDALYVVDPHHRTRFIKTDLYFDRIQKDKLAELQHIAFSLGAKKYKVEMVENKTTSESQKQSASVKVKKGLVTNEVGEAISIDRDFQLSRKSLAVAEFSGEVKPQVPTLYWFKNDLNITNLIHMRCGNHNLAKLNKITIEFKGSDYNSIDVKRAANVDAVATKFLSVKGKASFQKQLKEENRTSLIYQLEF